MFVIGDIVTLRDNANHFALTEENKKAKIICRFPESDNYLLSNNLYGYEYWDGKALRLVSSGTGKSFTDLAKYINMISQNETPFEQCSKKVQRVYMDKARWIFEFLAN